MYKTVIFTAFLVVMGVYNPSFSQCSGNESSVTFELQTDFYGYETSWALITSQGDSLFSSAGIVYENETLYTETFCVPSNVCVQFVIADSYGDGFTGPGYANLTVDGEEIFHVDDFDFDFKKYFNCAPGFSCDDAFTIDDYDFTLDTEERWYILTVPEVGQYEISTCNNAADCNTTIFVYAECPIASEETVEGTLFYNDVNEECGERALAVSALDVDRDYVLRIKSQCVGDINISISYLGPIEGCTDPTACNYNPLATVEDGSCVPFGDVDCPEGPDLRLNPFVLSSSMYVTVLDTENECLINEGCLQGVGRRDIVRFTTRIENIGTQDYFIGDPQNQPGQFTYDNCHNHFHYDGYAQYSLYDVWGQYIPIGYKNGFCVLDLDCPNPQMSQFGCDNMGITAGCSDTYDAGIDCQWLDITDVPDGDYVFVAVVNVDLARDALGRAEMDTLNNFAQVCINLDRSSGSIEMTIQDDCDVYTDCNGDIYGNALKDCEGNCGGTRLRGDRNLDQQHDLSDVFVYTEEILSQQGATTCSDLYQDGKIDVYDAAVLHNCVTYGMLHEHEGGSAAHDHCYFPTGVYNFVDTMDFNLKYDKDLDPEFVYIDITNPSDGLMAFQFQIEGADIEDVYQNTIISDQIFDIQYNNATGIIVGTPIQDFYLERSNQEQGLLKIKIDPNATDLCVVGDAIMVGSNVQKTAVKMVNSCASTLFSSVEKLVNDPRMEVFPIPTSSRLNVIINNDSFNTQNISCYAANGKLVYNENTNTKNASINVEEWEEGMYFVIVSGNDQQFIKKFIINGKE